MSFTDLGTAARLLSVYGSSGSSDVITLLSIVDGTLLGNMLEVTGLLDTVIGCVNTVRLILASAGFGGVCTTAGSEDGTVCRAIGRSGVVWPVRRGSWESGIVRRGSCESGVM